MQPIFVNFCRELLTGIFLFSTFVSRFNDALSIRNPFPTSPVNCYGEDLCIQTIAYIPSHWDIQVEAAENRTSKH